MTTAPTRRPFDGFSGHAGDLVAWAIGREAEGDPIDCAALEPHSLEIGGDFGGASALLEGSNSGEEWRVLNDPFGIPIKTGTPLLTAILERTKFLRPRVADGDDSTRITFHLFTLRRK